MLLGFESIGQQILAGVKFESGANLQFETRFDWETEVFNHRVAVNPFTAAVDIQTIAEQSPFKFLFGLGLETHQSCPEERPQNKMRQEGLACVLTCNMSVCVFELFSIAC